MRLIPFGAFQVMLGILFAMTIILALLVTADMIASEKSFQGSSTMLAILLLGLHRGQKLSRGGEILSEKEEREE